MSTPNPVPAPVATPAPSGLASVESAVKADVVKVETAVTSFWNLKLHPWLTHAGAVIAGYFAAHFGVVSVAWAALQKIL